MGLPSSGILPRSFLEQSVFSHDFVRRRADYFAKNILVDAEVRKFTQAFQLKSCLLIEMLSRGHRGQFCLVTALRSRELKPLPYQSRANTSILMGFGYSQPSAEETPPYGSSMTAKPIMVSFSRATRIVFKLFSSQYL